MNKHFLASANTGLGFKNYNGKYLNLTTSTHVGSTQDSYIYDNTWSSSAPYNPVVDYALLHNWHILNYPVNAAVLKNNVNFYSRNAQGSQWKQETLLKNVLINLLPANDEYVYFDDYKVANGNKSSTNPDDKLYAFGKRRDSYTNTTDYEQNENLMRGIYSHYLCSFVQS